MTVCHIRLRSTVMRCGRGNEGRGVMDEREWLAGRFQEHQAHLRAVAYRMLESLSEAEDAVQEGPGSG